MNYLKFTKWLYAILSFKDGIWDGGVEMFIWTRKDFF